MKGNIMYDVLDLSEYIIYYSNIKKQKFYSEKYISG